MFVIWSLLFFFFFFFNDTATTEIYTLSLHDALPIYRARHRRPDPHLRHVVDQAGAAPVGGREEGRRGRGADPERGRREQAHLARSQAGAGRSLAEDRRDLPGRDGAARPGAASHG